MRMNMQQVLVGLCGPMCVSGMLMGVSTSAIADHHGVEINVSECVGGTVILNGSFEEPAIPGTHAQFKEIPGWQVRDPSQSYYSIELQNPSKLYGASSTAADGVQVVELAAFTVPSEEPPNTIRQDVCTVPGNVYQLSFEVSPRPNVSAADNQLFVKWNDITVAHIQAGQGGTATKWIPYNYMVGACCEVCSLVFEAGTHYSTGALLDNVSIKQITP